MEIKGKVHCFFEQSGTFKNEFIKLGIPAEDYDIQDNFGQTDHKIDLFQEIDEAYKGGASVFDSISSDDLIMAFFPCIKFCSVMEQIQHEDFYHQSQKKKKNFVEREGDWTCFYCKNLNFSFRKKCNRCKALKDNSEKEHDKYMDNVLMIINENEKNRNKL